MQPVARHPELHRLRRASIMQPALTGGLTRSRETAKGIRPGRHPNWNAEEALPSRARRSGLIHTHGSHGAWSLVLDQRPSRTDIDTPWGYTKERSNESW